MEELKKCPFCGGKNIIVGTDEEIESLDKGEGTGYYVVVCSFNIKACLSNI